jgi:hypothetical protein
MTESSSLLIPEGKFAAEILLETSSFMLLLLEGPVSLWVFS